MQTSEPPETIALTTSMAAGDGEAVGRFYLHYFDALCREARRATRRDEAFCLDVVQESVLRVIRNVRAIESPAQFEAWLRLVVRTCALDLLRREIRARLSGSRVRALRVRQALLMDEQQVQDQERGQDERQDEHVDAEEP